MRRRKGLSFHRKQKKISSSAVRELGLWAFGIGLAVLLAYVLVYSVGIRTSVIGASMEPELLNGQEILFNRIIYKLTGPKRGDVIVFKPNGNENSHYYVKRVVGVPGDTVQIKDGKVYIDGKLYQESDSLDDMEDPGIAQAPIELGIDEYFVLGDNRNNSEDSRSANVGNVHKDTIAGKAWFKTGSSGGKSGLIH